MTELIIHHIIFYEIMTIQRIFSQNVLIPSS